MSTQLINQIIWYKGLVRSFLTKSLETNDTQKKCSLATKTVQNGTNDVKFLASLKTNFIRKTFTLEADILVSG